MVMSVGLRSSCFQETWSATVPAGRAQGLWEQLQRMSRLRPFYVCDVVLDLRFHTVSGLRFRVHVQPDD